MSAHVNTDQQSTPEHHPFCDLPGDPSLILTTNVDLGDKKMAIMKCELILQLCLLAFLSRVVYFQGLIIFWSHNIFCCNEFHSYLQSHLDPHGQTGILYWYVAAECYSSSYNVNVGMHIVLIWRSDDSHQNNLGAAVPHTQVLMFRSFSFILLFVTNWLALLYFCFLDWHCSEISRLHYRQGWRDLWWQRRPHGVGLHVLHWRHRRGIQWWHHFWRHRLIGTFGCRSRPYLH